MKKRLSLLMALMMVLSLVPMSAFAASTPYTSVQSVEAKKTGNISVTFELDMYQNLTNGIVEFKLDNAEFTAAPVITINGTSTPANVTQTGNLAFLTVPGMIAPGSNNKVVVNMQAAVKFDDAAGSDVVLNVIDYDTNIGSQVVKVAVIKASSSTADAAVTVTNSAKKVGIDGGDLSQFEIRNFGKLVATTGTVEISLPKGYQFATNTTVIVDGVITTPLTAPNSKLVTTQGTNGIVVTKDTKSVIVKPVIEPVGNNVSNGDVTATVTFKNGANTTLSTDAVIGQLVEFEVTMKVVEDTKSAIPTMYAGRDTKTVKVTLSGVNGSLDTNRYIDFVVDGVDVTTFTQTNIDGTNGGTLDTTSKFSDGEFSIKPSSNSKLEFTIAVKADYDESGTATITAKSRDLDLTANLAEIKPLFTASTKAIEIKKGEITETSDIVITEDKAGTLKVNDVITIVVDAKRGVSFADDDIKVVATNGLKFKDVEFATKANDLTITMTVDKNSTKEAGVITISDLALAVDGSTIDSIVKVDVDYNEETVTTLDYATVVKEYAVAPTTTVFTIDNMKYTVNGVEKTLLAAPYIKEGRTMLPVRALAEALGLTVEYNAGQAVFSSPTKTASHIIGTDMMYVNGTPVKLNVASELKSDTTFVELRSLAAAFGVAIDYDATTKAVTVQG